MSSMDFDTLSACSEAPARLRPPFRMGQGESGRTAYARIKRLLDIVFCILIAPAVLLVVAIAGLAIAVTMGRPVFFCASRVGRNGRTFKMIKLRTMVPESGSRMT